MNIEDRDRARHTRAQSSDRVSAGDKGRFKTKLVFIAVAVVTVTWVGVLFFLARELISRAFG